MRRWDIEQPFKYGNNSGNNNNGNERTHVVNNETEVIEVKSNVIFRDTCVARMRWVLAVTDMWHALTVIEQIGHESYWPPLQDHDRVAVLRRCIVN